MSRLTTLPATFVAVIDKIPAVSPFIAGGMEQTSSRPAARIQKSQSPAMITNNGSKLKWPVQKSFPVLGELSSQTSDKVEDIVMVRSDGRAASKTAQVMVGSAQWRHGRNSIPISQHPKSSDKWGDEDSSLPPYSG
jgi:hypothetical protein